MLHSNSMSPLLCVPTYNIVTSVGPLSFLVNVVTLIIIINALVLKGY